jgi:NADPH:quinone reductase-like Zn-dependent oxidoreductase
MRALRLHAYGAAPVLEDVPVPDLGADEVRIRVTAASLNPLDIKLHSGRMHDFFPLAFPYTLGTDLAGIVEQAGSLAARWRPGDKVVARLDPTRGGALADVAILPATYLAAAPGTIALAEAAGVPTAAGTAWQALVEMARVTPGQRVLIHAGAGGVGSFAIQLARLMGARVIATASGSGIDLAHRLGADQVIDYRNEDFAAMLTDLDLVLDTIGGETQLRSFGVLRAGGTLIATAMPPDAALAKAHGVAADFVFHQSQGSRLAAILGLIEAGKLQVLVDRQVPLADVHEAFQHQGSGRARGKIIIAMND